MRQNNDHFGWIERQERREGPSVVVWRYRQKQTDGSHKKLTALLGTVEQFKTDAAAWREAELNPLYASLEAGFKEQVRFGALCNRYIEHWKERCPESDSGWMFPSPITGRCYHASPIQQDYIRPAGRKLGLGDIGWHTFRHTYRSWLDSVGTSMGVQQKLMRHAQIATTMNVYGDAMMDSKRAANSKVVQMALRPPLQEAK